MRFAKFIGKIYVLSKYLKPKKTHSLFVLTQIVSHEHESSSSPSRVARVVDPPKTTLSTTLSLDVPSL